MGVHDLRQGRAEERVAIRPDHPGQCGVGVDDPIVLEDEDAVSHALHQSAVALLRIAQGGVQRLVGREIARRQEHRRPAAAGASDRHLCREDAAVAALESKRF